MTFRSKTGFTAVLFGTGLPGRGLRAHLEFGAHDLLVHGSDGSEYRVAYSDLEAQPGGWRGDGLLLNWGSAEEFWSLSFSDSDEIARFLATAPHRLSVRLEQMRRHARRSKRLLRGSLVLVLVLVLLPFIFVGTLLFNAERFAALAVERIPIEWEQQLGEMVASQTLVQARSLPEGQATQIVSSLMQRLLQDVGAPHGFTWHLVDHPEANAFALPGGTIVIWTGLLREMEAPEELAGVLAHEIQHVLQRHSMQGLLRSLGSRVTLGILLGGQGALGELTAELVDQAIGLRYSKQQEIQADLGAVEMLQQVGIDPLGLVDFFERLSQHTRELPEFFSTHPASQSRAERCRKAIDPAAPAAPLVYDWQAVQRELGQGSVSTP